VIANNATGKGSAVVKGAVRRGELLLPGLLRSRHCGRMLTCCMCPAAARSAMG
jgi:hypothetical protein